jgi:hypothetical protein
MAIVDEASEWYRRNIPKYSRNGVEGELRPPVHHPGSAMVALPESFECRGNALDIFLWNAGHLKFHVYKAATGELATEYHAVKTGREACKLFKRRLDMLVRLPPGARLPTPWKTP